MSDTPYVNSITLQIWGAISLLGIVLLLYLGTPVFAIIYPWIGLILGIAANEILPGGITEGIRIVDPDRQEGRRP